MKARRVTDLACFTMNRTVQGSLHDERDHMVKGMTRLMQGVIRRGMQVAALRDFILSQGASKNVTVQEWDKIWTMNKKVHTSASFSACMIILSIPCSAVHHFVHHKSCGLM